LSDVPVNDHKTHGLFDHVVGGINGGMGEELKIGFAVLGEALGHIPDQPMKRTAGAWKGRIPDSILRLAQV
jgi:hypothetical protein